MDPPVGARFFDSFQLGRFLRPMAVIDQPFGNGPVFTAAGGYEQDINGGMVYAVRDHGRLGINDLGCRHGITSLQRESV